MSQHGKEEHQQHNLMADENKLTIIIQLPGLRFEPLCLGCMLYYTMVEAISCIENHFNPVQRVSILHFNINTY